MNEQNKNSKSSFDIALVDSVTSEHLGEMTFDIGESFIDILFDDGVMQNIPIFGTVFKLAKFGNGVKENLFVRKIYHFLWEIKDVDQKVREEFINELNNNEHYNERAGETLLLLLDRLDNLKKPTIIGRLVKAKMKGEINLDLMLRLCSVVERAFLPDLMKLELYAKARRKDEYTSDSLQSLGLITHDVDHEINEAAMINEAEFNINRLGKDLLKYGLTA